MPSLYYHFWLANSLIDLESRFFNIPSYLVTPCALARMMVVAVMHHLVHGKLLVVLELQFVIACQSCTES